MPGPVLNPAGTFDSTFGMQGLVSTVIEPGRADHANAAALASNGQIVVAADTAGIFRTLLYSSAGTPDVGFGNGGYIDVAPAFLGGIARDTALHFDGRIVVAGEVRSGSDPFATGVVDFALMRLDPAGVLDPTFGNDGIVITDVGSNDDNGRCVLIQRDDQIIVVGGSRIGGKYEFSAVRYNSDGTLDTTFSSDGKVTVALGSVNDSALAAALQPDGKLILAGQVVVGTFTDSDFGIVRLNSDGSLDASFDGDGKLTTSLSGGIDIPRSIAVQADGRILAGGWSFDGSAGYDFTLVRYNADGSLDTSFDDDGKLVVPFGTNNDELSAIALQSDGKILAAGTTILGFKTVVALMRFDPDGSIDTGFGTDGRITFEFGLSANVSDLVVQPDGSILVAGSGVTAATSTNHIALARVLSGGIPDALAVQGASFRFAFAANAFQDPDGDPLSYAATLSDDSPLPAWLAFDPASREFTGTPGGGDVGTIDVKVTATDGEPSSISDIFRLSVEANSAPVLNGGGVADQSVGVLSAFSLALPADLFNDADADLLVYRASGTNTDLLPSWLRYDVHLRTFTGTPGLSDLATTTVRVTASDGHVNVSDDFQLAVNPTSRSDGTPGSDPLTGTAQGGDYLLGYGGNDTLDGLGGADLMDGGPDDDTYFVDDPGDTLVDSAGNDSVFSAVNFTLPAAIEHLTLTGSSNLAGIGNASDNVLTGNGGDNALHGMDGHDTVVFAGSPWQYAYMLYEGTRLPDPNFPWQYRTTLYEGVRIFDRVASRDGTDRIESIEAISFAGAGTLLDVDHVNAFTALEYTASYAALMDGFGLGTALPYEHFRDVGRYQGLNATFHGLDYLASNADLLAYAKLLGSVTADFGATHFIIQGRYENRPADFNALEYIASYPDLISTLGSNATGGALHYIQTGQGAGRTISFNGLEYIASYDDLMQGLGYDAYAVGTPHAADYSARHDRFGLDPYAGAAHYITSGRAEGRAVTFDGLEYIASYADLIVGLGASENAGAAHFITSGRIEGRATSFDALNYVASYGDLIVALGTNRDAGATHYIQVGHGQGRTAHFDAAQYLANYADLQAGFGVNLDLATLHFIQSGYYEGRTDTP